MNVDHLLDVAERLASEGRRPRETDLRRAISSAYYALFHCAARNFTDRLVGRTKRRTEAWWRVYRGIEHTKAKDEFIALRKSTRDPAVRAFAVAFVDLQEARHAADYDPWSFRLSRRQVQAEIAQCRAAIAGLETLSIDAIAEIAAVVLFKRR